MSKQKRWSNIIDICKTRTKISVEELVELLDVSPATIRRDLIEMEQMHLVDRFHGGVRLLQEQAEEPSMLIKSEINRTPKKLIAYYASKLIEDNMMVYLDAGSSVHEMLPFIKAKNITIVTPGISHLRYLGEHRIPTIVLGGQLHWSTEATGGKHANEMLEELYFDIAFVGTNGIHEQIGFTTSNDYEAATKHLALSHAKHPYILADSSKFHVLTPIPFAKFNEATIITDKTPDFPLDKIQYKTV